MTGEVGPGAAELLRFEIRDETDRLRLPARRPRGGGRPRRRTPRPRCGWRPSLSEVARDVLAAGGGSVSFELAEPGLLEAVVTVDARDARRQGLARARGGPPADGPGLGGHRTRRRAPSSRSASRPRPAGAARRDRRRALARRLPGRSPAAPSTSCTPRTASWSIALGEVGPSGTSSHRQHRAGGDQPRGDGALRRAVRRAGDHQPGRGRALRRDRRQERASCARRASPRPASSTTSATSCAPPATPCWAWRGCCSTPDAEPLTAEQRQQVEFINASAEDLLRLVNELLDLAKAESGRIEPTVDARRPRGAVRRAPRHDRSAGDAARASRSTYGRRRRRDLRTDAPCCGTCCATC